MNDRNTGFFERYGKIAFNAFIIGILFELLFCMIIVIMNWSWNGVYDHRHFNSLLDYVKNLQWLLIILIIPLFAGIVSAIVSSEHIKNLWGGAFAGIVAVMVFGESMPLFILAGWLLQLSPGFDQLMPITHVGPEYFIRESFIKTPIQFFINYIIEQGYAYLLMTLLPIIFGTVGTIIYSVLTPIRVDGECAKTGMASDKKRSGPLILMVIFILALTLIPQTLGYIGVDMNLIHRYPHDGYNLAATVHRNSNDSVTVSYNGGPDADIFLEKGSFIVCVNDKNATNMDAIRESGLAATLDPATGLENKIGSTVTITGSDISYKTHVVVTAIFQDGTIQVILDTYVRN